MTNMDAKRQSETASLDELESGLAATQDRLAKMLVKRDEAKANLETLEARRRGLMRSVFMGIASDAKAKKAAELERNDAAILVEDLELLIAEEQAAVQAATARLYRRQILQEWSKVTELGKRRADLLDNVIKQMEPLLAACAEFKNAGQQIVHIARRTGKIPAQRDVSERIDPIDVARYVGNDDRRLSCLVMDRLPVGWFPHISGEVRGNSIGDNAARESAWWKRLEIPDTDANSTRAVA